MSSPKHSTETGLLLEEEAPPLTSGTSRLSRGSRKLYEPSARTLGSFPRIVGPAADARELEYISSLHQNAEEFVRKDGTICCKCYCLTKGSCAALQQD